MDWEFTGSSDTAYDAAELIEHPKQRSESRRILLTGDVPSPLNPPPACQFHTRCWKAQEICRTQEPPLAELAPRPPRRLLHPRGSATA